MLTVRCLGKKYNKNVITHYTLQDNAGNIKVVTAEQLKSAMINKQVECNNLILTSDNRIIETREEVPFTKNKDTDRVLKKVMALGGVIRRITCQTVEFGYKNAEYRIQNGEIHLGKVSVTNGVFEIPSFVTHIMRSDFDRPSPFSSCTKIKIINNSNIKDMSYLFNNCTELVELDLRAFDTSNVTNMRHMFAGCISLKHLDLSSFNTSRVINMDSMFCYIKELEELDVSSFNTVNVANMQGMFYCCTVKRLKGLTNFELLPRANISGMFACCDTDELDISTWNLERIDISGIFYDTQRGVRVPKHIKYPKTKEKELREEMFSTLIKIFCNEYNRNKEAGRITELCNKELCNKELCNKIVPLIMNTNIKQYDCGNGIYARACRNNTIEIEDYNESYIVSANGVSVVGGKDNDSSKMH